MHHALISIDCNRSYSSILMQCFCVMIKAHSLLNLWSSEFQLIVNCRSKVCQLLVKSAKFYPFSSFNTIIWCSKRKKVIGPIDISLIYQLTYVIILTYLIPHWPWKEFQIGLSSYLLFFGLEKFVYLLIKDSIRCNAIMHLTMLAFYYNQ